MGPDRPEPESASTAQSIEGSVTTGDGHRPDASAMAMTVSASAMTVTEVTGLIQLFNNQLLAMEGRLIAKIEENSASAAQARGRIAADLEASVKRNDARFEKIEGSILVVEKALEDHLDREREEDVANEARIKPIKGSIAWFWKNWRDVVLLFIGIVAAGTFFLDWVTHLDEIVP